MSLCPAADDVGEKVHRAKVGGLSPCSASFLLDFLCCGAAHRGVDFGIVVAHVFRLCNGPAPHVVSPGMAAIQALSPTPCASGERGGVAVCTVPALQRTLAF